MTGVFWFGNWSVCFLHISLTILYAAQSESSFACTMTTLTCFWWAERCCPGLVLTFTPEGKVAKCASDQTSTRHSVSTHCGRMKGSCWFITQCTLSGISLSARCVFLYPSPAVFSAFLGRSQPAAQQTGEFQQNANIFCHISCYRNVYFCDFTNTYLILIF